MFFVGRITRQKGIDLLLDAAPLLDPAAQLVLAAAAPDTPEMGAEVAARGSTSSRASGRGVIWVEEPLPRTDVVQLLSHARAFVCPSVYEPFGLVNVEAMACGAPVVASAVGGIPEIVVRRRDRAGWCPTTPRTAPASRRRWRRRSTSWWPTPGWPAGSATAGRRRVLEHFGWDAVARRTVDLYVSTLMTPLAGRGRSGVDGAGWRWGVASSPAGRMGGTGRPHRACAVRGRHCSQHSPLTGLDVCRARRVDPRARRRRD